MRWSRKWGKSWILLCTDLLVPFAFNCRGVKYPILGIEIKLIRVKSVKSYLLQNFTILKILRTLWERICGALFLFFPIYFFFHKQELDNYENIFYKVEMLKATNWLISLVSLLECSLEWRLILQPEHMNYYWRVYYCRR